MKFDITHRHLDAFHFRKKAFSNNGHVTMETKDPRMMDVIGEQKHLSKEDIIQINKLYKCDRMLKKIVLTFLKQLTLITWKSKNSITATISR